MFRRRDQQLQVLIGHPGGPFWRKREAGVWTIPKGRPEGPEDLLAAAIREFREETGLESCGPYLPLGHITQGSGKVVHAWAFEGDCDPRSLKSNATTIEWPPRSGRQISIPEIDRIDFFSLEAARSRLNTGQVVLLQRLLEVVG